MSYFVLQMEELLGGVNELTDTTVSGNRISTAKFWFPATAAGLSTGPSHLDRGDENRGTNGAPPLLIENYDPSGRIQMRAYPNLLAPLLDLAGYDLTIVEGDGTNEVQTLTITGTPTGGTFTITYSGETSGAIPYNATAAQVQSYLENMAAFRVGDVVCAGGPLPGTGVTITFQGRFACTNVALMTTTDSLTGGSSPESDIAETSAGTVGSYTDPDGAGIPADAYKITCAKRTGPDARTARFMAGYTEHSTYIQGHGFGVSSLGITAAGEVSAELMGLYAKRVPDPSLGTPAPDAATVLPLRRGDFSVSWISGGAKIQDFSVNISNPVERGDHLGIASYYPKVLERTGSQVQHSGSISNRQLDPDDYDAMVDAGTFAATAKWVGASQIGSTGKHHSLWIEYPACQLTGGDPDDVSNAPRSAATYEWSAGYDESAGYDAQITLVCGTSTVETYA